jgi:hypothetical protein
MIEASATSHTRPAGEPVSYVLKWHHGTDPRICWFIRGIQPDRSFYGEIMVFSGERGKQINVTGSLSESDYARFLLLVRDIEKHKSADESNSPWEGLLAVGPPGNPRILFRYRHSEHQTTRAAPRFLEVVNLIAPYLRRFQESLD